MSYLDLHCDTLFKLQKNNKLSIFKNPYQVDLERLKYIKAIGQFFAIYIDSKNQYNKNYFNEIISIIEYLKMQLNKRPEYAEIIKTKKQFYKVQKDNKLAIFLTVEDGGLIADNFYEAYKAGIRLVTLTWNYNNKIGYSSFNEKYNNYGLTDFGKEIVRTMNELGIIIDVSHLSDKGFWDVINISQKPVVASHSNSRNIYNHRRNLSDEMIKALANKGGIMGINFSCNLVGDSLETKTIDLYKHIVHIINIGGTDVLAIGSDYDGIANVTDFGDISGLPILAQRLKNLGIKPSIIDKIMYKNAIRVINDVL
ncbi:dipeptidase [Defluviitalea phaphyphila]|uniref:dipeptidase n=1 Tax=Defluviitalea phaphyphila TaxID=1473580 RepID=UPI0007317E14|nr:dipeptidase [Defluviitalea phaphyphila]